MGAPIIERTLQLTTINLSKKQNTLHSLLPQTFSCTKSPLCRHRTFVSYVLLVCSCRFISLNNSHSS